MAWKPGVSGNPKGRPKKVRTLTAILEKAGGKKLENTSKTHKQLAAELLWTAAATGRVTFPDGSGLQLEAKDWLDVVEFLYKHIDGPPLSQVDVTSGDEPIAINIIPVAAREKPPVAGEARGDEDEE